MLRLLLCFLASLPFIASCGAAPCDVGPCLSATGGGSSIAAGGGGAGGGGGGGNSATPSCNEVCTAAESCGIERSQCEARCPQLSQSCRQCLTRGCGANCDAACGPGGPGGGSASMVQHGEVCSGTAPACGAAPLRCTYAVSADGSAIGTWSSTPVCRVTCSFDAECASATNGAQAACCPLREGGGTKVCVPTFECNAQKSYSQCKASSVACRSDIECCSKRCSATFGTCE